MSHCSHPSGSLLQRLGRAFADACGPSTRLHLLCLPAVLPAASSFCASGTVIKCSVGRTPVAMSQNQDVECSGLRDALSPAVELQTASAANWGAASLSVVPGFALSIFRATRTSFVFLHKFGSITSIRPQSDLEVHTE